MYHLPSEVSKVIQGSTKRLLQLLLADELLLPMMLARVVHNEDCFMTMRYSLLTTSQSQRVLPR